MMTARQRCTGFHQESNGRRRRVPDGYLLLLKYPVPTLGIEFIALHHTGDAQQQRGKDPIGRAGHPPRIGTAPKDIIGVQVQGVFSGDVVGQHRAMDMQYAFWGARRTAGEV